MADRIVTIAASGADYTTFPLAIAGEDDFQAGEDNIIFRRTDDVRETSRFTVSGFTTSSAHRVILDCTAEVQHDGTRGSGAGIVASVSYSSVISASIGYVFAKNLEVSGSGGGSSTGLYNVCADGCLIYGCTYGMNMGEAYNVAVNNIIYGGTIGITLASGSISFYLYNNTVLNCGSYGINSESSYNNIVAYNNYVGGCGDTDYNCTIDSGGDNYSEDGSASTTAVSIANCLFTNSTAGSEDVNIGSDSDLIGIGTDLSGNSVYAITVDCFGNSRSSTPCIGAVEYVSSESSGGPLVGASALVGGGVLCGQGNLIN
jgi:hypothetical protein